MSLLSEEIAIQKLLNCCGVLMYGCKINKKKRAEKFDRMPIKAHSAVT
jgi:hypothetical protein